MRSPPPVVRSAIAMAFIRAEDSDRPAVCIATWGACQEGYPELRPRMSIWSYADEVIARIGAMGLGEAGEMTAIREGNRILGPWLSEMFPPEEVVDAARGFSGSAPGSGRG